MVLNFTTGFDYDTDVDFDFRLDARSWLYKHIFTRQVNLFESFGLLKKP